MRRMLATLQQKQKWVCIILMGALILTSMLQSVPANAKTYAEALSNYQQADFQNCIKNARIAMKARISSLEKSKVLKVMGICHFMVKNKTSASVSFKSALKFNPNLVITTNEVLDTEVIGFFNEQKASVSAAKKGKAAPKPVGTYAQSAKKTTLQVNSNVSGKVSIEGIYAGVTGSPIDADGGSSKVTVTADGYRPRTVRVNVSANKENLVTINLAKPKPKRKKAPPPPPAAVADRRPKKPLPPADEGLFADEPVQPQLPERDLRREFEAETGSGGYAYPPQVAPAPVYQQPVYQQPMYAPPPVYAPPPMAAPPIVEAPPPNYGDDGYTDNYNPPARKKSRGSRRARKSARSDNNILITLAPFGAGQFQNGSTTMGIVFLAAEAGSLIYWYMTLGQADELRAQAVAALAVLEKGETPNCTTEEDIRNCQIEYLNKANPAIGSLYDQASYGLYAFGGLWVAGVVEAMINEPSGSRSSDLRRRDLRNQDKDESEALAWSQFNSSKPYWDVDLKFDPETLKPMYGLGVRLDF